MPIKYALGIAVLTILQVLVGLFLKSELSADDNTITTPSAANIIELARYGDNDHTLISADGSSLIHLESTDEITITDAQTNQTRVTIDRPKTVSLISLSPNGHYLSLSTADAIIVWDTLGNVEISSLETSSQIENLLWSADSTRLLVTMQNGDYQTWAIANNQLESIQVDELPADWAAIAWDADHTLAAISIIDGTPRLISTNPQHFALDIDLPADVTTFALAPHDDLLAYGTKSGTVGLLDIVTGQTIKSFAEHQASIQSVQWSPDGNQFVSIDGNGVQIVWGIPLD